MTSAATATAEPFRGRVVSGPWTSPTETLFNDYQFERDAGEALAVFKAGGMAFVLYRQPGNQSLTDRLDGRPCPASYVFAWTQAEHFGGDDSRELKGVAIDEEAASVLLLVAPHLAPGIKRPQLKESRVYESIRSRACKPSRL